MQPMTLKTKLRSIHSPPSSTAKIYSNQVRMSEEKKKDNQNNNERMLG